MKALFAAVSTLVLFFGAAQAAFAACPDLAGTYGAQGSTLKMKITQDTCTSITFTILDEQGNPADPAQTYVADGQPHPTGDGGILATRYEGNAYVAYDLLDGQTPDTAIYKVVYSKDGKNIDQTTWDRINPDGSTSPNWIQGATVVWTAQ